MKMIEGASTGGAGLSSREKWRRRWPVIRFVGLFLILVAGYYAVTSMSWFAQGVFPANLRINARVSAWILTALGEGARSQDEMLMGPAGSLAIRRGCDALEPAALFAAAVLAFPAAWKARLIGVAVGVPVLLVLNLARIVSLYYVLKWRPGWFEAAHVDVWQPLFILFAMVLWALWVMVMARPRAAAARAEA